MKIYNMMMQKMHIELFLEYKLLDFDNYCIYFLNISINFRLQKKEDIHIYVYPLFFLSILINEKLN